MLRLGIKCDHEGCPEVLDTGTHYDSAALVMAKEQRWHSDPLPMKGRKDYCPAHKVEHALRRRD